MTASRTCRACGVELHGDVMWCLRCYEPVRHLTPRDPGDPTISFLRDPDDGSERSRWKAGVNTFGPVGRIVVTLLVLAFAPRSTNLVAVAVIWPAYLASAAIVLRATWKKDHVVSTSIEEIATKGRPTSPTVEPAPTSVPRSTIAAYVVIGLAIAAGILGWGATNEDVHAALAMCGAIALLVIAVRLLVKP
jgi:hypothetical protein